MHRILRDEIDLKKTGHSYESPKLCVKHNWARLLIINNKIFDSGLLRLTLGEYFNNPPVLYIHKDKMPLLVFHRNKNARPSFRLLRASITNIISPDPGIVIFRLNIFENIPDVILLNTAIDNPAI
jgi:hypothetical protein